MKMVKQKKDKVTLHDKSEWHCHFIRPSDDMSSLFVWCRGCSRAFSTDRTWKINVTQGIIEKHQAIKWHSNTDLSNKSIAERRWGSQPWQINCGSWWIDSYKTQNNTQTLYWALYLAIPGDFAKRVYSVYKQFMSQFVCKLGSFFYALLSVPDLNSIISFTGRHKISDIISHHVWANMPHLTEIID